MRLPYHIKAVIFDMDGVIINSEPYWAKADKEFFRRHSKPYTPEINLRIMGMGQREIIESYKREFGFVGETQELIQERKKILYEFLFADISLMDGVKETVHLLHKEGFTLAVATSGHTRVKAQEILEKVFLQKFFPVIVSGDDVYKSKPAPDIYLKTAQILQIDPSQCLVIEDAPNGVKAGKAAGMVVYGVNTDEKIYATLQEAGADFVARSLRDIIV